MSRSTIFDFLSAAVFFLLLCLRVSSFFTRPQFLLEDGTVFFVDAYNDGARSLGYSYAGYLVLYQRLVAWLFAGFEILRLPLYYFLSALLVPLLLFAVIFAADIPRRMKFLFAAVVLFLPFEGVELATLVNSQWVWALILVFLIAADYRKIRLPSWLTVGIFTLGALSGPFILVLLPLAIVRAARNPSALAKPFAAAGAVASVLHLSAADKLLAPRAEGVFAWGDPRWPEAVEMVFAYPLHLFTVAQQGPLFHLLLAGLSMFLWFLLLSIAVSRGRTSAALFLFGGFLFASAALAAYRLDPDTLLYRPRYALIPTACFAWAAIDLFFAGARMAGIFVLPCFAAGLLSFFSPPLPDLSWPRHAGCFAGVQSCVVPLNWAGKFIRFDPEAPPGPAKRRGRITDVSGPEGQELFYQQHNLS